MCVPIPSHYPMAFLEMWEDGSQRLINLGPLFLWRRTRGDVGAHAIVLMTLGPES